MMVKMWIVAVNMTVLLKRKLKERSQNWDKNLIYKKIVWGRAAA